MTASMRQTAAWLVLLLAMIVFVVGRNRNVDIAMIVIVFFCVIVIGVDGSTRILRKRREQETQREEQQTPWTMYSRPAAGQRDKWEVGIERRVGESRLVLDHEPPDAVIDQIDNLEIEIAKQAARTKAQLWTDDKVRM